MASMSRPTKVWMVALGRSPVEEVVGELRLEADGLLFTPRREGAPATRLRFETISKATRVRGSPILMITHALAGAQTQTAFYFTQPPTLTNIVKARTAPSEEDLRSMRPTPFGLGQRTRSKRRSVRTNATYLTQEGTSRKKEIQEWVEQIRRELPGA
jgi:hypothetical protein